MSKTKIFINPILPESERNRILKRLPEADIFFLQDYTEKEAREKFIKCDVVFGNPKLEWTETSENLEWIQLASAGLDPYQHVISKGDIQFSNLKDFFSKPVAETVLAGVLTLYRNIHLLIKAQDERKWAHGQIRSACETVSNKNILILGPGSIGRMIGKIMAPLGGQISMFGTRADFSGSLEKLDNLLRTCDILIGSLPESEATIRLLDERRLNLLPESAILVNVGRGSLIDEPALIRMLRKSRIRGAFLDVTEQEPISSESELWDVPNLVLGQHAAGGMPSELSQKVDFFIENYAEFRKGNPKNIVAPEGVVL